MTASDEVPTPVQELTYMEASAELDEIVRFFEQRDVDVDHLVSRLVRATAIIEELDARLRRTRLQVEQLVPRLAAVASDERVPDEREPRAGEGARRPSTPDGASTAQRPSMPELF